MQNIKSFIQSIQSFLLDDLASNDGKLVKKISSHSGSIIGGTVGAFGGSINMPLVGGVIGGIIGEEMGASIGKSFAKDFVEHYGVGIEPKANKVSAMTMRSKSSLINKNPHKMFSRTSSVSTSCSSFYSR